MKRLSNAIGLKAKFLGPTNTQDSRIKLTQTNIRKSCIIPVNYEYNVLDQICHILDGLEAVKSYQLVIDNTQQDYYLFAIDCDSVDLIKGVKKCK